MLLNTSDAHPRAGLQIIMSIAGHVTRVLRARYSHVRMEAKRRALDEIAARQRAADAKCSEEAEERKARVAMPTTPVSVVANVQ